MVREVIWSFGIAAEILKNQIVNLTLLLLDKHGFATLNFSSFSIPLSRQKSFLLRSLTAGNK